MFDGVVQLNRPYLTVLTAACALWNLGRML